ncbi:Putative SANT/Myb domain-containing protein [Septoria linicola]|uniref:SANT/Myb domain-containing protein n=1 Tax=Septoria linicola TaxID=215465 RepID=A0A9Q9AII9_9PEZI|nr:putative SANT/Myb domain-containing protein [Septoria linicola]USW46828.1 Putative SANT/Myb domain-containing protein [Septoria linicola]
MGRLSTSIAATATHADNLPGMLPNVSALDVLLPRSLVGSSRKNKPLNHSSGSIQLPNAAAVGDAEIKRDSKGRLVMVRHKGSSIYGRGSSIAGSDVITFEDLKKSVEKMKQEEGSDEKKSGKGSKKGDAKKDEVKDEGKDEKKDDGWTMEEDATLREFKTNRKGLSWKDIAAEMGKGLDDLKARWKVLQAADKEGGGENKKTDDKKADDNKSDDNKADEKKDEAGGKGKGGKGKKEGDGGGESKQNEEKKGGGGQQKMDQFVFTEAQDKELRECVTAGTNWKLTAKAVKRSQDACKKRWEEIGCETAKKEEPTKEEPKREEAEKKSKPSSKTKSKKEDTKKDEAQKPASVTKAPSKAASAAGSVRSTRSSVKFSIREWRALQEDEFFSFEELQILCQLIGKHGDRSWLGIASAFHDKTGRRVHPEDIREKFEAMGEV